MTAVKVKDSIVNRVRGDGCQGEISILMTRVSVVCPLMTPGLTLIQKHGGQPDRHKGQRAIHERPQQDHHPSPVVLIQQPKQAQIDTVNRYLSLVEGLLGEGGISETPAAGNDKYPYGMHISYLDLLGETVRYTLYYDKIFRGGDKDEEESEAYYSIEGELIVEGRAYPVEGNYTAESETDKDESEESGTLEFTAYTGENSYIRAVQETERETEEDESGIEVYYVYTVVEEGKVIERTEVE